MERAGLKVNCDAEKGKGNPPRRPQKQGVPDSLHHGMASRLLPRTLRSGIHCNGFLRCIPATPVFHTVFPSIEARQACFLGPWSERFSRGAGPAAIVRQFLALHEERLGRQIASIPHDGIIERDGPSPDNCPSADRDWPYFHYAVLK